MPAWAGAAAQETPALGWNHEPVQQPGLTAARDRIRLRDVGTRLIAGCMTGTSIDALDAVLVRIERYGLSAKAQPVRCATRPLGNLATGLRALASGSAVSARQISELARDLALLHVDALRAVCDQDQPDLIAIHGQTVFHAPPLSWQLINAAPIAHALRAPVVFDLRAADLAAGGQGAPITPLADYLLFASPDETRAIVNLGGFCNFTLLPRAMGDAGRDTDLAAIRGGDMCACNHVLDALARRLFGQPFDDGGDRAGAGQVRDEPRDALQRLLAAQARAGRSLGTGDELARWLDAFATRCAPDDLTRSACAAIANVVRERVSSAEHVIVAGGGTRNRALMDELRTNALIQVSTSDQFGVPAQCREAIAMAVLGALCADGVPITLPQVTGVRAPAPLAGCWVRP